MTSNVPGGFHQLFCVEHIWELLNHDILQCEAELSVDF